MITCASPVAGNGYPPTVIVIDLTEATSDRLPRAIGDDPALLLS
jgi:hypothetical protein